MRLLLIGAGNMGGAMLKGLCAENITVVQRNPQKVQALRESYPGIQITDTIPPLDGYIVILAIKPQSLATLETSGKAIGLISVLAGVSLERLRAKISAQYYVRAMPNMAALVQKSATSLCGDAQFKERSMDILGRVGKCFWLESEDALDIATGLAGSAPAWLALSAEALSDGAVNLGLGRQLSYEYIAALFEGVGVLLQDIHPALLKDKITSPNGTTIAGIAALEEGRVRDSFIKALAASYERTKKL